MTVQGDRVRSWRLMGFGDAPVDLERQRRRVTRAIETQDIAFAEPAAQHRSRPALASPHFSDRSDRCSDLRRRRGRGPHRTM
jgi:hypothetical protein